MLPKYQARSPFVLKHTTSIYIYILCNSYVGEARGIRAVIFHNPDVAMAQLFYTIVAATTTLSYPPIWDQPYHI